MKKTHSIPYLGIRYQSESGQEWVTPVNNLYIHYPASEWAVLLKHQEEGWTRHLEKGSNFLELGLYVNYAEGWEQASFLWTPNLDQDLDLQEQDVLIEYAFQQGKQGCIGFSPGFRVHTWAKNREELEEQLAKRFSRSLMELPREQRMTRLLMATGFRILGFPKGKLSIPVSIRPNQDDPQEGEEHNSSILPSVATRVPSKGLTALGQKKHLDELISVFETRPFPSVLVVGPSGSGKTLLLKVLMEKVRAKVPDLQFYETNAGRMIKGLINHSGWEYNLPILVEELQAQKGILFVNHAADLLQVGQYDGNTSSLGDGMKKSIKSGALTVLAECTPEELRWMDNKAPEFAQLFYKFRLEVPQKELEPIITHHFLARQPSDTGKQKLAIRELIQLQKRFESYSGQPGKAIRFLESFLYDHPLKALSPDNIRVAFAEQSGIPIRLLDPTIPLNRKTIEGELGTQIFGQPFALEAVASTLVRLKAGMVREQKPIASFLFVGPTGVGKTELAHELAYFLFGSRDKLIRLDMSEYGDPDASFRLVGRGALHEGQLTGQVRKSPFTVLLLDEIEKGDARFLDLLLQVLGDGRLTDEEGVTTDFGGTVIIMTSNLGAERLSRKSIGWNREDSAATRSRILEQELLKFLRPELLNRVDELVPFQAMALDVIQKVLRREWAKFLQREGIRSEQIQIHLSTSAEEALAQKGYDPKYGVRKLQRTLRNEIYLPLAEQLRPLDTEEPTVVHIDWMDSAFVWQIEQNEMSFSSLFAQWGRVTLADQVSSNRRYLEGVADGPVLERLDNLSTQLQWEEGRSSGPTSDDLSDYQKGRLENLLATFYTLKNEIEQLEVDVSVDVLDKQEMDQENRLDEWKGDLHEWTRKVIDLLDPKSSSCHLIILGREALIPAYWYESMLQNTALEYEVFVRTFKGSNWGKAPVSNCQEIESLFPKEEVRGIEFQILGDTCFPFLKPESGFQKWQVDQDLARNYAVLIQEDDQIPEDANRKSFFLKKQIRRTFRMNEMQDNQWKAEKITGKEDQVDFVLTRLEQHLLERLDSYLLSGEL